jgi:ABC-2 type transport system ATP-binding protein
MARRISLAQALINDPDLLILDEPTTGLDPIGTRQIKDLILQLAKRGKTVLLCSHLLADVEDVCDRIAILYGGKVQSEGKVRELLQQTDKKQITTGHISDSTIEKIKRIVQEDNADCVVSSPMDKLETFFIKTVAAAQQQTQSVSGAVSTTEIGEFLTFKTKENILDKLVSASVSPKVDADKLTIDKVTPVETAEAQPDEKLLKELSKPAKPPKTEPVVKTKPVEPKTEQPKEVKKSILDQLTDSSQTTSNSQEGEKSDNRQGDSSDA